MRPYEPTFSRAISRGSFTLRERRGQWILSGPLGDLTLGHDEAAAVDLLEECHRGATIPAKCYFVGEAAEIGKPVKIGFTRAMRRRLGQLQAASPYRLHVLAIVRADDWTEREYHDRFAAQRLHGEWFTIDAEILAEIERLRNPATLVELEHVGMKQPLLAVEEGR